jgi:hypothetical protein
MGNSNEKRLSSFNKGGKRSQEGGGIRPRKIFSRYSTLFEGLLLS